MLSLKSKVLGTALVLLSMPFSVQAQFDSGRPYNDGIFQRGLLLYTQGQYASAKNMFTNAMYQNSRDSRAAYYFALCCHRLGDLSKASIYYQRVIRDFPNTEASRLAQQGLSGVGAGYVPPGMSQQTAPVRSSYYANSRDTVQSELHTMGSTSDLVPTANDPSKKQVTTKKQKRGAQ
jgi:tetratricopeptide (TPR) repeat protein